MYARSPSHPAALGLNLSGSVAGIPERHPLDKVPRDVYPTLFPKNGAAPFTLAPDGALKNNRENTQSFCLNERRGSRCLCRYPVVTGSTVVAVKFAEGVVLAADTLGIEKCEISL